MITGITGILGLLELLEYCDYWNTGMFHIAPFNVIVIYCVNDVTGGANVIGLVTVDIL